MLSVPRFTLGELDRDSRPLHPEPHLSHEVLVARGREDVVVHDVRNGGGQIPVALFGGILEAVPVEVELELRRKHGRVAERVGSLVLLEQNLSGRGDDRAAVLPGDVAEHERRPLQPRNSPERREIRNDREVAVAAFPIRHGVARNRIHLHIERQQIVATLDAMVDDVLEEVLPLDALADQPSLHVGEGGDDRVDRPGLHLLPEVVDGEHPLQRAGASAPRRGAVPTVRSQLCRIGGVRVHEA